MLRSFAEVTGPAITLVVNAGSTGSVASATVAGAITLLPTPSCDADGMLTVGPATLSMFIGWPG